jgi:hypothetical protein
MPRIERLGDGTYSKVPDAIELDLQRQINEEREERILEDKRIEGKFDAITTDLNQQVTVIRSDLHDHIINESNVHELLQANIEAETAARIQADEALEEALQTEISERIDVDSQLSQELQQEAAAREVEDTALWAAIDLERDIRAQADIEIRHDLDEERAERIAADEDLQAQLDHESLERKQDVADLQSQIDEEKDSRIQADNALFDQLQTEIQTRTSEIARLDSRIDFEAAKRQAADNSIIEILEDVEAALDGEIEARIQGDSALRNALDQEIQARENADTVLQEALDLERTTRESADASLEDQIDTERSTRTQEVERLDQRIDFETSERTATDEALQDSIDDLEARLISEQNERRFADANLETLLNQEKAERIAADNNLEASFNELESTITQDLASERLERITADDALLAKIEEEALIREQADTSLRNDMNAADALLQGQLETEIFTRTQEIMRVENKFDNAISEEGAARESDVAELTSRLNNEIAVRTAEVARLDDRIDQEIADRTAADNQLRADLDAERDARISADSDLQDQFDNEAATRLAEDTRIEAKLDQAIADAAEAREQLEINLQNQLDEEIQTRIDEVSRLDDRIDQEIADRTAAVADLQDQLNTEIATRIAEDANLQSQIDAHEHEIVEARSTHPNLNSRLEHIETTTDQGFTDIHNQVFYVLAEEATDEKIFTDTYTLKSTLDIVQDPRYFVLMNPDGTEVIGPSGEKVTVTAVNGNTVTLSEAPEQYLVFRYAIIKTFGTLPADAFLTYDVIGGKIDAEVLEVIGNAYFDGRRSVVRDGSLDARIIEESLTRQQADADLQAALDAEKAERESEAARLDTRIGDEIAARKAADDALQSTLQAAIDAEKAERIAADEDLQDQIAAERDAREQAVRDLQEQISEDIGVTVSELEDALAAEKAERQQEDARIEAKFDQLLADEIANRIAADDDLQAQIDAEAQNRDQAISDLQDQITNDIAVAVANLQVELAAETQARKDADTALQQAIDNEASTRASEVLRLEGLINSEATARANKDTSLQNQIDSLGSALDDLSTDFNNHHHDDRYVNEGQPKSISKEMLQEEIVSTEHIDPNIDWAALGISGDSHHHDGRYLRINHASGSYDQMLNTAGSASDWIRTTTSGLLPASSNQSSGSSSLGTAAWPFASVHAKNFYGYLHGDISGNADTVDGKHASDFAPASHTHPYDNYSHFNVLVNGTKRFEVGSKQNLDFVAGDNVTLAYDSTNRKVIISSSYTNTWRGIHDTPVNGATDISISSNWAYQHINDKQAHNYVRNDTSDTISGTLTATNGFHASGGIYNHHSGDSYDKIRVHNSNLYTIGMKSGQSFGYLNDWAMTFTFSNHANRGFLWRDADDASNDGAMSLTTDGRLYVKDIANAARFHSRDGILELNNPSHADYKVQLVSAYDYDGWFRVIDGAGQVRFSVGRDSQAYIGGVGGETGKKVWHEGNDGHNSGLDADTLDGEHASQVKENARKLNSEFVLETRTSDPVDPVVGRMWLRVDL